MTTQEYSKLLIVWATGDKDVALNMVFMYAINSKLHGWWKDVVLLIWGSSSRLSAQDSEVQSRIASAQKEGVRVIACKRCAENLHVVEELEKLGVSSFAASGNSFSFRAFFSQVTRQPFGVAPCR